MPVRNYDKPNPARVVANLRKVLTAGDLSLLQKGTYEFLITHCGFIAHYNHAGFIDTYRRDLPHFVSSFLTQHGLGWDPYLDNPHSYLYDVSYRERLLADIIRELIPIFQWQQPAITASHTTQKRARAEARLRSLADELGYDLVKR